SHTAPLHPHLGRWGSRIEETEREVELTDTVAPASRGRGVIYVHSAPRAVCPHVEWAVGRALGRAVNFDWREQPVLKGALRTEYFWEGERGTGATLASALRGWEHLRYEVTEDAGLGTDGGRWMHT